MNRREGNAQPPRRGFNLGSDRNKQGVGHKNGDITTHYSAPEVQELIEAAERVCHENFGKTSAVTLPKKKAVNG